VAPDEIAADYALSDVFLAPLYREMLEREADPRARTALAAQLTSDPESILAALEHVEAAHGGVEAYLAGCGVSPAALARLRRGLRDDAPTDAGGGP
jgi:hypothetical protein